MKTQGFFTKNLSLKEAMEQNILLSKELGLWGSMQNFEKLNYDKRSIHVFLLYYYNEIVAGITYYEKNFFGNLRTGYSPHPNLSVPYAHVYIKHEDSLRAREQLLDVFIRELTKFVNRHFTSFSLILPKSIIDMREFYWNSWNVFPRYTYMLDLQKVREAGLAQYVGKKVRNIIKYAKLEMTIRPISAEQFYNCYKDTYLRQNKPCPKPLEFFKRLQVLENMVFLGAFSGDNLTSGVIVSKVGNRGYFVTAGALDDYHNRNGVTLLLYSYLESLLQDEKNEVCYFDFVGANTKKISFFKSCFQPEVDLYFEVKKTKWMYKLALGIVHILRK